MMIRVYSESGAGITWNDFRVCIVDICPDLMGTVDTPPFIFTDLVPGSRKRSVLVQPRADICVTR